MKKTENKIRCGLITMTAIISVLALLLLTLPMNHAFAQDSRRISRDRAPGINKDNAVQAGETLSDDLCSINAIRRYLAGNLRYPSIAAEAGQTGIIELYARINSQGRVNEVLELQPVRDYVEVDEIVVVGYAPQGKEINESSRHESLIVESRRVVMSMPRCDIQEIFGKTLKFTIKFVLQ